MEHAVDTTLTVNGVEVRRRIEPRHLSLLKLSEKSGEGHTGFSPGETD
jgi:hypothetical protein